MIKKLLTVALIFSSAGLLKAQVYPVKTIQEVQTVSQAELALGNDAGLIGATDTIRVRGIVVMDANLSTLVGGKQIWIQTSGNAPFSGLDIFQPTPATGDGGTGILALLAGDSVEITGTVLEFSGETELVPLNTTPGTPINILGGGFTPTSKLINVADLNDANRANILTTGEQWEGMYVEFQNVTVQSVDPFSSGSRVSFNIIDAAGNKVNVSDRFKSNRLPATGGTFIPPNVGDFITSIKGVIIHSKNNRGYELHPFKQSDIVYGASAPAIAGITRNPVTPTSTQTVTISANITDLDGVASASLFYAAGVANNNFVSVPMVAVGNSFSATVPAQAEGTIVKYYVSATDASVGALVSKIPNVPSSNPLFYVVRDAGLQIFDLQYTPFTDGNSGLTDQLVTVTGVVTATPNDLGYVYIQQENQLSWAGILCTGNAALSTLVLGDRVTVTGTVKETFNFTRIEAITSVSKSGTGTITPLVLNPAVFNTYNFVNNESYEGMLIKFEGTPLSPLTVVKKNADAPSNFAEFSVGLDPFDPASSSRVLAGRGGSALSSLNVSYINDSLFIPNLNPGISPIIINQGDKFTSITGIILFSFSNMKLLPRDNNDFVGYSPAVGLSSVYAANSFVKAFPNPASTSFTVNYTLPAIANNAKVVVYDLLGKEILTQKLAGVDGSTVISVNDLANGTYLYQVQSAATGILAYGKLVVSK